MTGNCHKAIAYLKPDLSSETEPADSYLAGGDELVIKDLRNGLLVTIAWQVSGR